MRLSFNRVVRLALCGAAGGLVLAYSVTYLDHIVNGSATAALRYSRSETRFWLTIPALSGEAVALLTTSRDWMFDDAWETCRHLIALYNALFCACILPVFAAITAFGMSRLRRSAGNA